MTLAGVNAKHPWLDNRMCIVGYEPIKSPKVWSASKILLGKAVHEVVNHLQLNPPEIIEITDVGLRSIQQPKTPQQIQLQQRQKQQQQQQSLFNNTHTSSPIRTSITTGPVIRSINPAVMSGSVTQQHQPPSSSTSYGHAAPPNYESIVTTTTKTIPDIDLPPIPNRFNEIDNLSKEELQKLWEDEGEFLTFCNNLPLMQNYGKILRSVLDENTVAAKKNLSKQEELQDLYNECCKLESSLAIAIEKFQQLELQQDVYWQPPDRKLVIKELMKAKKDAFDESEQIAKDWLNNVESTSVDDFLTSFVSKRKLHHERAAKLELVQATPIPR
jgi:ESCRT-I complex subunit VPS37